MPDVLGFALIPDDRAGGSIEPLAVPPHQHLEQDRLPCKDASHDLVV
jgi:hypothetical protein